MQWCITSALQGSSGSAGAGCHRAWPHRPLQPAGRSRAGLMERALQHKSDEERLREVGDLVWRKGDLEKRGDFISLYNLLQGGCDEVGDQTLFPSNKQ